MGTETCCDFLTITNNDPKVTEKFSRRYSGFILVGLPQVFTTPGRSISVRFTSDDGIEYRGFRFSYRAIPDPQLETTLAPTTTVSDSPAIQHYLLDDATLTYDTARQHCIDNGADLCLKSDICINYVPAIIGIQDGDHWTPVRNGYNDWVEVGNDNDPDGKGRVCFRHNELYSAPRWGTTPGPCPPWNPRKICDIKSHVFCCRNISSN
ncbi:unnamed protein product [Clavelina lepadiformis]|uniref:DUF7495 domain-containing protein n=1 Tax=Clavelina lepadiformis TaxID=159417 RepID=A0ABP0F5U3_CLALP